MKKCPSLLLTSAFLFTTTSALAGPISWNYISAGVTAETVEIDGVQDELKGNTVSFGGSFSPVEHFALGVSYATGSADVSGNGNTIDMELDGYSIGGLYYTSINPTTDVFVGLSYSELSADLDLNGSPYSSENVDGHDIFIGVRGMVNPKLELRGTIERSDYGDDPETDISFGASYYVASDISLSVGYSADSDSRALGLGVQKHL